MSDPNIKAALWWFEETFNNYQSFAQDEDEPITVIHRLLKQKLNDTDELTKLREENAELSRHIRSFCNWAFDVKNGVDLNPQALQGYRIIFSEALAKHTKKGG